ncbi:MAG: cell wall hydrolase [Acetatifactor sp.]|nr:cell wall hydrolase [Acetatifactor sp.]
MKRYKRTTAILVISYLAGAVLAAWDVPYVSATSSTQQQIQEEEREKEELEGRLDETQTQLEGLKGTSSGLKKELSNLNAQLAQVVSNLEDLERRIAEKQQEILDTQAALEEAKETESWQYECMVARARVMYEMKEDSHINALISAGSFSEVLNAADYYSRIARYDQEKMEEYTENRELIEAHEARLQAEYAELENLKTQAEAEKSKVSGLISQTSNAISQYADQISDAERQALEYEQEIKQKESSIEELKKKYEEERALSRAAANAAWRDISEVAFDENDRYLLANLIYCEAGGEPYDGKVAVGSVVINRVLSSQYPDSVLGVIYQNRQFSPVASGRLDLALSANRATADCYRAADEAMSGITNVGNCVYFRTPIEGLEGIRIGGHIFY